MTANEELLCPLCDYDLRGLVDPRCPECGYAFTWEELNDTTRRLHPYAFEHHPERNVWSFRKTLFAGLRPGRFWRTLYPTQPSRPRRLVVYWVIGALFALLPMIVQYVRHPFAYQQMALSARVAVPLGSNDPWIKQNYGSVQAYHNTEFPLWPSPRAALMTWRHANYYWAAQWVAVVLITWPWLTFAALMVFQRSMRRARLRAIHVLRCVLYTSDAAVWVAAAALLIFGLEEYGFRSAGGVRNWGSWRWGAADRAAVGMTCAAMLLLTIRLAFAYRLYLRFSHAIATALASQVIVGLIVFKLFLDWEFIRGLWW